MEEGIPHGTLRCVTANRKGPSRYSGNVHCRVPITSWFPRAHWMVNPNSGNKLAGMRVNNTEFPCYLKHPDVSFWEAVGHHEGQSNRKKIWPVSLTRAGGVWKDPEEYHEAWGSDIFCYPEDAMNKNPRQFTEQSRAWSRAQGGRASSPRQVRR